MSKGFLTRRKFGAVSLVGCSTFVLGGMRGCEKVQTIDVTVNTSNPHAPHLDPIKIKVEPGTTRIRFRSATPKWVFVSNDGNSGAWEAAPRFWLDGDENAQIVIPSPDGKTCETTTVPKKGFRLNFYFVMAKSPKVEEFFPDGTRVPGDCGGGGSIEAE